jgi:outer membrane protein insertion porin family
MRSFRAVLRPTLGTVLALWLAGAAAAQGPTIVDIRYEGLRSLSEESVSFYLGLEKGQALDEARLNGQIRELWGRRLIDAIEVRKEPVDGGVRLVIAIEERPILRSIRYEGLKRVGSTDINDRVLKERIHVREGDPLDMGEIARLKTTLEEMYREKGYRFAEVRYDLEEPSADERRVVFTVDEGDKVRIARIQFEGAKVFGQRRLRWTMRKTKESAFPSRVLKRDVYNPATLAEDMESVRKLYRADGYKNAKLGEPRLEVRALKPDAPTIAQQDRQLFLSIPVEEGERWLIGDITIEGNEKFGDEILLAQIRRRPSKWLRSKLIDDGVEKISEAYRNAGFINSEVTLELREKPDAERVADVVIHVVEGEQFKVGRLEFQGNDRTLDKVLRREFRLHEGMFMNMGALKNSLLKMRQLEFFKPDENDPVEFQNVDAEKKTIDLLVKGQESDRTELEFGGAYNEVEKFSGLFSMRTRNFLGRGESLGVSFSSGHYRDEYELSYGIPWFLDRPQSLSLSVFRTQSDLTDFLAAGYRQDQQGATLSYGRSVGYFSSFSFAYTRSAQDYSFSTASTVVGPIDYGDPNCTAVGDGTTAKIDCDREVSILRPQLTYNTVDSRFEPSRGTRFTLGVAVAGGALGGNSSYYRPEIELALFRPVTNGALRTVFGFNIEAGLIEPYDGRILAQTDLRRLGREIRGFRRYSIIARDENGTALTDAFNFGLGGNKWVVANLEYHFLTGGPFRFVLFADAGNVYAQSQSWDVSRLRYTAGAEFRILVPVLGAPLRFIYAKNLDPLDDAKAGLIPEDFKSFQFDIGFTF